MGKGKEHPHCPDCLMLYDEDRPGDKDVVVQREGPGYDYYCRNCKKDIDPDEITDAPWLEGHSNMGFTDKEEQVENGVEEFSDNCDCYRCNPDNRGVFS